MGFSGSNGGLYSKSSCFKRFNKSIKIKSAHHFPLETSFFINNYCNLSCRHCYVGYSKLSYSLSTQEWTNTFDELISLGGRTFGNVGKEPLLVWDKTKSLLEYFKCKKQKYFDLRFGFVTNGILLDDVKIFEIGAIMPDYIDISLDGNRKVHDFIRGEGAYGALMANLRKLAQYEALRKKVFISFTLNRINAACVSEMVSAIYGMGYCNLLISPYVTLDIKDILYVSDDKVVDIVKKLLQGDLIDFSAYKGLNIYIKNDFTTTRQLMEKMAAVRIIRKDELLIDDYGVIFNKYDFGSNTVYFNYMPFDTSFNTAIRISHDGYVSNCLDMFYEDYPARAVGNLRNQSVKEILGGQAAFRQKAGHPKLPVFENNLSQSAI